MSKTAIRTIVICLFALLLSGCLNNTEDKNITVQSKHLMPGTASQLQQGKRLYNEQHYKEAMRILLPLACDCIAEAEYAVGYMYYYGNGVPQDTDMGTFWIRRAAQHGYKPADAALRTIATDKYHNTKSRQWPRGI
jgi:TPR repeat protein